jgi:hypothetical protein
VNAAQKQGFVGVNVAHPGYQRLIQQRGFNKTAALLQGSLEIGLRKSWRKGLRPQGLQGGDHRLQLNTGRHQPHLAKGALIHKAQVPPFLEGQTNTSVS